jgi:hypothetical protein
VGRRLVVLQRRVGLLDLCKTSKAVQWYVEDRAVTSMTTIPTYLVALLEAVRAEVLLVCRCDNDHTINQKPKH